MGVENRQNKSEQEENRGEPTRDLGEHIGRLGAEDILGYAPAKSRAQAFAFGPLHQDHKHHEHRDEDVNPQEDVNQKGHLGRAISPDTTEKQTRSALGVRRFLYRIPNSIELVELNVA